MNDTNEMKLSKQYNISIETIRKLKKVRSEYLGQMSDNELLQFHIEWTTICNQLKRRK